MAVKYPLKFKAAILERHNKPLIVDEVRFAGPLAAGQVLVQIHYSGICGKQIEEIRGSSGADPFLPHMLGHEGSGVVVDVGPGVKKVVPGDHVVLHWVKGSGIEAATPVYTRGAGRINAGWVTTFNEYGVISENRMTVIHRQVNMAAASLLGCAVTTGMGVVINEAKLRPAESLAVFGCGGVGLNAIQAAALIGGYPIIAVDKNSESLELAREFGASHTLQSGLGDIVSEIRQISGGEGARVVIVTAGQPKVIETAVEAGSIPGAVYLVAVPPAGSRVSLDPLAIHRRRKLNGSFGGGTVPDRDIVGYLGLYERGLIKLDELISHTVSLEDINKGVDLTISGTIGRCLVKMTHS